MKTLLIGSLLLSSTVSFAQSIDLKAFKNLLTSKKAALEVVKPGMTKKVVTVANEGSCTYMLTSTQTILKVESDKVIILSKEKFQPQNSAECRAAGYTTSSQSDILYYEAKPSIVAEIEDLDVFAQDIKAINVSGNVVTMNFQIIDTDEAGRTTTENITNKYDLSKPIFKYTVSSQSVNFKTTIEDMADVDLSKVDLKDVLFCDNNDGDESECVQGDFSDILFN